MMRALLLSGVVLALCSLPAIGSAQLEWRASELPSGDAPATGVSSIQEAALIDMTFNTTSARLRANERDGLRERLRTEFQHLHQRYPNGIPSLLEVSHRGRQAAGRFDALIAEPEGDTDRAVVFLHGYGGNAVLPCAIVAEAAGRAGAMTICPTIGGAGHWRGARGARILAVTLDWLENVRGADNIVLAGLSNGGIGASALVQGASGRLSGLLLLSGAARGTRTNLPALVVHGDADTMTALPASRAFVRRSPNANLELVQGNHFVMLHEREAVATRMSEWLTETFRAASSR